MKKTKFKKRVAFTLSCKTFSSDSSQAKLTQSPAQSSQTKLRSYGFTLAETLIVLVILGTIAAITIPALVRNHIENANRTKLKKCMTVYDVVLSKYTIENNIKSQEDLNNLAGENCANTRPYFKSVQDGFDNCTFRTADGMWWNIREIDKPLISFNEIKADNIEDLKTKAADGTDFSAFYLYGWFDSNGNLRVDDPQAAPDATIKSYLTALYNYINGKKETSAGGGNEDKEFCDGEDSCTSGGLNWNKFTIGEGDGITLTRSTYGDSFCTWDPEEKTCTATNSVASEGPLYISEQLTITEEDAKKYCDKSRDKIDCESYGDYWIAAAMKCKEAGGSLPTAAELQVMRNKGQLPSGYYWAAEASPGFDTYSCYFGTYGEGVDINGFATNYFKAVCVGK